MLRSETSSFDDAIVISDDVRVSVSTPQPPTPPVVYHAGEVYGRRVSGGPPGREPSSRDSQMRWLVEQESGISIDESFQGGGNMRMSASV